MKPSDLDELCFFYPWDDDEVTQPGYTQVITDEEAKTIFGDAYVPPTYNPDPWFDPANIVKQTGCFNGHHDYIEYVGLMEKFWHCKKCGKKK